MGMTRPQKEAKVVEYNERFANDEIMVVAQYSGLTVKQLQDYRTQLRAVGATFYVTKNALAKMATKGTRYEGINDLFTGPVGMASSSDPVAAAKVTYEFAKKNNKLIIMGGALGELVLDVTGVEALAKLPSLDEVRSKLCGLIVAAPTKLVGILQAPARDLVGVTKAYSEKA